MARHKSKAFLTAIALFCGLLAWGLASAKPAGIGQIEQVVRRELKNGSGSGGSWTGDQLTLDEIVLDVSNADTFLNRQAAGVVGIGATSGAADGTIYVGDGTLGAPSYSFGSDTDTGMFRVASDQFALVAGGQYLLYCTSGGGSISYKQLRMNDSAALSFGTGNDAYLIGDGSTAGLLKLGTTSGGVDGQLHTGALHLGITSKTAAYTATTSDHTILCDASGGAFTITLPAASNTGLVLEIKKTDSSANAVTVDGAGAETIDGSATKSLASQWDSIKIQATGSVWVIL